MANVFPARAASRTTRAKIPAKLPATLEGHLAALLRLHVASGLPRNHRTRNGGGFPLSAWMLGAHRAAASRILSVDGNTARYPYKTQQDSSKVLFQRIARRYQITRVQAELLQQYINRRYAGQIKDYGLGWQAGVYGDELDMQDPSWSGRGALDAACDKIKTNLYDLPLRAILDPHITNLLLLIQLNSVINCINKRIPL